MTMPPAVSRLWLLIACGRAWSPAVLRVRAHGGGWAKSAASVAHASRLPGGAWRALAKQVHAVALAALSALATRCVINEQFVEALRLLVSEL